MEEVVPARNFLVGDNSSLLPPLLPFQAPSLIPEARRSVLLPFDSPNHRTILLLGIFDNPLYDLPANLKGSAQTVPPSPPVLCHLHLHSGKNLRQMQTHQSPLPDLLRIALVVLHSSLEMHVCHLHHIPLPLDLSQSQQYGLCEHDLPLSEMAHGQTHIHTSL